MVCALPTTWAGCRVAAFWGGYWPDNGVLVSGLLAGLLLSMLSGFGLMHLAGTRPRTARVLSWSVVLGGFSVYSWLSASEPPGIRMLLIIGIVLLAMKGVVAVETVDGDGPVLTARQWLAWAGGWPGMSPDLFSTDPQTPERAPDVRSAVDFLRRGVVRMLLGALLLAGATVSHAATGSLVLATILALPGISLILHFGIFNLLCSFWRACGIRVYTLFPAPLRAQSLGEFWGRRWNLPFTEMIQRAVYRPLVSIVGRPAAALCGFGFSGLLHECAISVPVSRGYGLPLLYFALHGGLVALERGTGLEDWLRRRPVWSRVWTVFWLVLPMGILFHPPFLRGIVWPLAGISG